MWNSWLPLMLASRIVNQMRRTTVAAHAGDLATLEAEAERRGVATTVVIAEAIAEKASALRQRRKPRFGLDSTGGRSPGAAIFASEPVADPLV